MAENRRNGWNFTKIVRPPISFLIPTSQVTALPTHQKERRKVYCLERLNHTYPGLWNTRWGSQGKNAMKILMLKMSLAISFLTLLALRTSLIFEGLLMKKIKSPSYDSTRWQAPPSHRASDQFIRAPLLKRKEQLIITSWRKSLTWETQQTKKEVLIENRKGREQKKWK